MHHDQHVITRPAHRVNPKKLQNFKTTLDSNHLLTNFGNPLIAALSLFRISSEYLSTIAKMSLQTPRILPSHLNAFHPSSSGPRSTHTVRILGTVTGLRGDQATITCGNNGDVTLLLKPDSHLQMGKLVEVVGKVTDLEGGQVC